MEQTPPAELMAVLVAGLMLFIGLLRYVVSFMKGYEKRRLELIEKYEATLTENVMLRGQVALAEDDVKDAKKHSKFIYKEYTRYKKLYEDKSGLTDEQRESTIELEE